MDETNGFNHPPLSNVVVSFMCIITRAMISNKKEKDKKDDEYMLEIIYDIFLSFSNNPLFFHLI